MLFFNAIKPILKDFLSTIVFVSLVWITDDILLGTCAGVATGVVQTGWMLWRRHPIGALQWLSIAMVMLLGSTTLITGNGIFFKLKSSVLALSIGAVLLNRKWLAPYLPPIVTDHLDARTITRAAYVWAVLMALIAVSNVLVASFCSNRMWATFIFTVPAVSYITLLGIQYLMFRKRVLASIATRTNEKPPV
jgi:intracellular septation protein